MMSTAAQIDFGSWSHWHPAECPVRLGASACLLGEAVRFDGSHQRDRFLVDRLGEWIEFVRTCPEVEVGMSIPRPTLRLTLEDDGTHLVAPSTEEDWTERMRAFAEARADALVAEGLDGFVLKKGSPSCGMERVKLYRKGMPSKGGVGLFAQILMERHPGLPVEEDGRLNDPRLRENFIERVFCRNRWRTLVAGGLSRRRLVEFHTAHKLLLLAHDEPGYRRMGRLVGSAGEIDDAELFEHYELEFQEALRHKATPKSHTNVLQHALGHLKQQLGPDDKQRLLSAIEDYRSGLLPLVVPLTMLRYEIQRHRVEYLMGQLYFDPHPKELMLRNHV